MKHLGINYIKATKLRVGGIYYQLPKNKTKPARKLKCVIKYIQHNHNSDLYIPYGSFDILQPQNYEGVHLPLSNLKIRPKI